MKMDEEGLPVEKVYNTLKKVSIFRSLFEEELQELSKRTHPIELSRITEERKQANQDVDLKDGNMLEKNKGYHIQMMH
ncbi:MAG: hypothetical protein ACO3MG_11180 [Saprospiraceae bacterium]|jgi:hypothetical protein|nr:hypothetical protein [Chitinophagia bacterium]